MTPCLVFQKQPIDDPMVLIDNAVRTLTSYSIATGHVCDLAEADSFREATLSYSCVSLISMSNSFPGPW